METGITKLTLTNLPMEDIAGDLHNNKDFALKSEVTEAVDNAASKLADAYIDENNNTLKNTVENAMNLGGISYEEYVTKTDNGNALNVAEDMSTIHNDEIANLRDELYQLKMQLSKNGYIDDVINYEGFSDSFKNTNKKYTDYICGIETSISGFTNTLTINDLTKLDEFYIGSKFLVYNKDTEEANIITINSVDDLGTITFDPSINTLYDKELVEIRKIYGMYYNGTFSFSELETGVDNASKEKFHMQTDDTTTNALAINKSNAGFATFFKVPNYCFKDDKCALSTFSITGKAVESPGDLICYVLKEDAVYPDGTFKPMFKSIEDAKNNKLLIAKSKPVSKTDSFTMTNLEFDFCDPDTGKYPELNVENGPNKKYLFVIVCNNADESNYWRIGFSYFKDENLEIADMHKYNKTFNFDTIPDTDVNKDIYALNEDNGIGFYDILFCLATKTIIEDEEIGHTSGLYSAKIVLPKPINVSRARLTSRINREGYYFVQSIDPDFKKIYLDKCDEYSYSNTDLKFTTGDIVIIGNQIATVKDSASNWISFDEPVYIDRRIKSYYTKNDECKIPVYRMNYKVTLKPSLVDWNTFETEEFKSTDLNDIKLDLTTIIPDGLNKTGSRKSDRLIFENIFGDKDIYANEFELQIEWKSKYSASELNAYNTEIGNELIGRIHDLVLSFDKTY